MMCQSLCFVTAGSRLGYMTFVVNPDDERFMGDIIEELHFFGIVDSMMQCVCRAETPQKQIVSII